jgi:rRNA maturation endonuclease Nob1
LTSKENNRVIKFGKSKHEAILLASENKEDIFMVTTARKSSIEAKNICPQCQNHVNRNELIVCDHCGSEVCRSCLEKAQEKEEFYDATEN